MATNVYAIADRLDGGLYQFGASEDVLAKDAVLAFVEEQGLALFGNGETDKELFQSELSKTSSMEELTTLLEAYDMSFSMIQIKGN